MFYLLLVFSFLSKCFFKVLSSVKGIHIWYLNILLLLLLKVNNNLKPKLISFKMSSLWIFYALTTTLLLTISWIVRFFLFVKRVINDSHPNRYLKKNLSKAWRILIRFVSSEAFRTRISILSWLITPNAAHKGSYIKINRNKIILTNRVHL